MGLGRPAVPVDWRFEVFISPNRPILSPAKAIQRAGVVKACICPCVALPGCPRCLNAKRSVPPGRSGMFGALGRASAVLWVVLRGLVVLESPRGRRWQLWDAAGS